jgi:hypothetical protein
MSMIDWSESLLRESGYRIGNSLIESADLNMENCGCLDMTLSLSGQVNVCFGGYVLGKGYLGANDDYWKGSAAGLEYIMRIMDVVGVERFQDLKGKYVRVAHKGLGSSVKIIGNITKEKWFDAESFFRDKKENEDE